jgi:DNA-binding CsgD family transcriptional regulator/PAS domain-containing protein
MLAENDLIDRIYAAVTEPQGFAATLDLLAKHFQAQSGVLLLSDLSKPGASLQVATGHMADTGLAESYAGVAALDPSLPLFARFEVGTILSTSAVFSPDIRARDAFYQDWYLAEAGLAENLGTTLLRDDSRVSLFGLQRAIGATPFSAEETAAVARLVPHLQRALRLHRHFDALQGERASLAALLDQVGPAAFLVDVALRVRAASPAAQRLAAVADGIRLDRTGRLTLADPEAERHLARSVASTVTDAAALTKLIRAGRPGEGGAYTVMVSRFVPPLQSGPALALVVVHDPASRRPPPDALNALFGLTPRESELVHALLQGLSLEEHCAQSKTSRNTAKTHLRAVFHKTGARSQADLVRRVLTALP